MSIETYSVRRHYLSALSAKINQTGAERAAHIRARLSLGNGIVKPTPNAKVQAAARQRRLRLAAADSAMTPAPKAARLLTPAACSSWGVGSLYDGPERLRVARNVQFPRLGCG
jgi:chemotaxis response regulator CheB